MFIITKDKFNYIAIILALAAAALIASSRGRMLKASSVADEPEISFPVVMYHSVSSKYDRLNDYVLNISELERDLKHIQSNGYETVLFREILEWQKSGDAKMHVEKPIVIVFDDGFYNNYSLVMPLFEEYGMKFCLSVVGSYIDKETELGDPQAEYYSYCTWDQLKEMHESGNVELFNHSYNMHVNGARRGVLQKGSESNEAYLQALTQDILKCQGMLDSIGATHRMYAYPFGFYSKKTEEALIGLGFNVSLSCATGVNHIAKSTPLMLIKRYNRPHGISSETFFRPMFSALEK
ncbi:MAG: polysaccharide deacetylase family protein [Eubacteriaceae bacterium]|nr:polysaccharide deacetylase family protein [Eubacteriaceae bacterium]